MKKLYFLFLIIACSIQVSGQCILSQEFGRTYGEVKQFLNSKPFAAASYDQAGMIIATTDGFTITYFFNDDVLYKTVLVKQFDNEKEAQVTTDAFRNYYAMLNADHLDLDTQKGNERFVAMAGREIHEVSVFTAAKTSIQVIQSKMDLDRCPGHEMKEIVSNEALLAMLAK